MPSVFAACRFLCLFMAGLLVMPAHAGVMIKPSVPPLTGLETISNGILRVGVDGRYGGAITYLAAAGGENMVNNHDLGRQVQIALYGGPADYAKAGHPAWSSLGWNPVQAGDAYGTVSEVTAFKKEANLLYVRTIGRQFALRNVASESTIEHWVRLAGNVVKVHVRIALNRADKTQYDARTQEFPCFYLNRAYNAVYTYQGAAPYTADVLTRIGTPAGLENVRPVTEPWIAAVNEQGFGVGLYVRDNYQWTRGGFGTEPAGGEFSSSATYMANTRFEILDHNLVQEWDYELIVGELTQIRNYVYAQPRLSPTIGYRFDESRSGWYYSRATDTGWPIQNGLQVRVTDARNALICSPAAFWRGNNNLTLYLRAAFQGQSGQYRLHWRQLNDREFLPLGDRYVDFEIIGDGKVRVYTLDMSRVPGWADKEIIQLALRPRWDGPPVEGWVKIESLWANTEAPPAMANTPAGTPAGVLAPTPAFGLTAPAYDCATGAVTFRTTGGNGAPVEYMASGLTDWTREATHRLGEGLRQDPAIKPLTLMARQSGIMATYAFDFRAVCPAAAPAVLPKVTPEPLLPGASPPDRSGGCRCPVFSIKKRRR